MIQEFALSEKKVLTNCEVQILEGDIFHINWNGGKDIEIQDIDELAKAFGEMTQGRKMKVLQEFDHFTSISNEARKYAAETAPDVAAIAYVIKGLGQRMDLRFYLNIRRRKVKAKVFMSKETALRWIKQY
ncbi:hypothetical protein N9Y60_01990 [Crocinitomicaceae bacterium]|nr:hypothetical protein [Crocinitomicaceae bacterium]